MSRPVKLYQGFHDGLTKFKPQACRNNGDVKECVDADDPKFSKMKLMTIDDIDVLLNHMASLKGNCKVWRRVIAKKLVAQKTK